jgi:UDP-N-acetylglucosamine 2-epimerase (non-hydrolysing)
MKIVNVVGARPNFMKMAPLVEAMKAYPAIRSLLIHTGQHYDTNMSKLFFDDLALPTPDVYLEVGSGSHAQQTAKIMIEMEKVLLREQPDLTLVVGDVNSTIACALTSVKLGVPVAHVESGLRSYDRTMPEEINRVLTDAISTYLFTTERGAATNLLKEGIPCDRIFFVGNVMIDSLLKNLEKAHTSTVLADLRLIPHRYALLTLHRPSNVDDKASYARLLEAISRVQDELPVVYPVHPRTRRKILEFKLEEQYPFLSAGSASFRMVEPQGYLDFLQLMRNARLVLTDSGGVQEETTVLGVPCITMRENTERPVTVSEGTNVLVGTDTEAIVRESMKVLEGKVHAGRVPELWDGKAANRIVAILAEKFSIEGPDRRSGTDPATRMSA